MKAASSPMIMGLATKDVVVALEQRGRFLTELGKVNTLFGEWLINTSGGVELTRILSMKE